MIVVLAAIAVATVAQFIAASAFMFGVGAVHTWIPVVPTIGFGESCVIVVACFLLSLLGTFGVRLTFGD